MNQFFRLLLIEDDNERVEIFRSWLPADVRLVHAGSAGRALGILQRDREAYAGIILATICGARSSRGRIFCYLAAMWYQGLLPWFGRTYPFWFTP